MSGFRYPPTAKSLTPEIAAVNDAGIAKTGDMNHVYAGVAVFMDAKVMKSFHPCKNIPHFFDTSRQHFILSVSKTPCNAAICGMRQQVCHTEERRQQSAIAPSATSVTNTATLAQLYHATIFKAFSFFIFSSFTNIFA